MQNGQSVHENQTKKNLHQHDYTKHNNYTTRIHQADYTNISTRHKTLYIVTSTLFKGGEG